MRFHTTSEGNIPFTAEEEAEWEAMETTSVTEQIEFARTQYRRDRAKEYPSIGDQLDALWKGGEAATIMLAQVQAVKAKYPKPTE